MAYVVRNDQFTVLVRAVSVLLPRTGHRIFFNQADALKWLRPSAAADRPPDAPFWSVNVA